MIGFITIHHSVKKFNYVLNNLLYLSKIKFNQPIIEF